MRIMARIIASFVWWALRLIGTKATTLWIYETIKRESFKAFIIVFDFIYCKDTYLIRIPTWSSEPTFCYSRRHSHLLVSVVAVVSAIRKRGQIKWSVNSPIKNYWLGVAHLTPEQLGVFKSSPHSPLLWRASILGIKAHSSPRWFGHTALVWVSNEETFCLYGRSDST